MKMKITVWTLLVSVISIGQTEFPIYDQVSFINAFDADEKNEKVFVMASAEKEGKQYFNVAEFRLGKQDVNPMAIHKIKREEMINMIKEAF
jgi:hypothetical protein